MSIYDRKPYEPRSSSDYAAEPSDERFAELLAAYAVPQLPATKLHRTELELAQFAHRLALAYVAAQAGPKGAKAKA